MKYWLTGWFGALWCGIAYAFAALSMGDVPKYQQGFGHFDYVNPVAPKGGVLKLSVLGGFDSFNPYSLKGDKEMGATKLLVETLMARSLDEPFTQYGLLADEARLAKDGLSMTFHLNPAARFSNGDPVTALDVAESFNVLTRDPTSSPLYRFYWADVRKVSVLNNLTVRFEFKRRNAELHMIIGELPVFSHKWLAPGKALADQAMVPPIGSGPYLLESYKTGAYAQFRRNPFYWARQLPVRQGMFNFDRIVFRYYRDDMSRLEAFKAGEFDVSYETISRQWARGYVGNKFDQGLILKQLVPNHQPKGMQGFVFNLRRSLFADKRVRQALGLAFDFEWVNQNLFYGLYKRSPSYFTNSEMAASGVPSKAELAILMPLQKQLDPAVFGEAIDPPVTVLPYGLRDNLRLARQLLLQAGWHEEAGKLVNGHKEAFQFEFVTYSKAFERVVSSWQRNLSKLGIAMSVRVLDPAVYQRRLDGYDYDVTSVVYPASSSPGNEQFDFHGCLAAKQKGSRNWAGLCDPAVEKLLQHFATYHDRHEMVAASRALDRVLRAGYYVVPNWYGPAYPMAWWNRLAKPAVVPDYYDPIDWVILTWWAKP